MKLLSVPPAYSTTPGEVEAKRYNELFYLIPFLLGVVGLKLALSVFLWRTSFLEYDTDGFTRSVRAWDWYKGHTKLEVDAWLPLQFWVNGWLMGFWPDLLHVPRLVNIICSVGTTVNLFFIGRQLFGRLNGYGTALLAAIFPWEILFGLSGMSESMTHFFLSFGFVFFLKWLKSSPAITYPILVASLGFLGATMIRYEAWFYSTVYAAIVVYFIWQYRANLSIKTRLKLLFSLVPAFVFVAIWAARSWIELGSPLGFADKTSSINSTIFGSANENVSFWQRLIFYPKTFFLLFLPLTVPAIVSMLVLCLRPVKGVWPYLVLVWGEFALFILTTLPYNNIAPGSQRYPVSNLLLLLPVITYLAQLLVEQPGWRLRLVGGVGFALLFLLVIQNTFAQATLFPDDNTRRVADFLNQRWREGYINPDEQVYLILPPVDGPKGSDFTRTEYALRVLTNHPDNFEIVSDPAAFMPRLALTNGHSPHIWVYLLSAGGSVDNNRTIGYGEIKSFGDYRVGDYPFFGLATAERVSTSAASDQFNIKADEYHPQEKTSVWVTRPDNKVIQLDSPLAGAKGVVSVSYTVSQADFMPGKWSVTIAGMESGRRTSAVFEVSAK